MVYRTRDCFSCLIYAFSRSGNPTTNNDGEKCSLPIIHQYLLKSHPKRREQNTNRILSLDLSFVKLSIQITTMKLPTLLVFLSLFGVARGQQEQNDYLGVNVTSAVSAYTTVLGRLSLFGFMDKIVFVLSHP